MVRIHAMTRFPATPSRTAESRLVEPTPKMQAVMVWVVLTGAPKSDAPQMTAAAEVLGGETVHGLQLEDLVAHRLDDLPAAERRAHRHGEHADALDPEGNRNRVDLVKDEEGERDHAHGLLGIVEAVARRHEGGGNDLQLGEGAGELVAVGPGAQEHDQKHGQEAHAETGERRQDQREQVFSAMEAPLSVLKPA